MGLQTTEQLHSDAIGLDDKEPGEVLSRLHHGQLAAARGVECAIPSLAQGAGLVADALGGGNRLAYAGAGSSGLMALADGLELPGTYGIPEDRIVILLAEGRPNLSGMPGVLEDDATRGAADVRDAGLGRGDCMIAISASGGTPYVVSAARAAHDAGLAVIGIANNERCALLDISTVGIFLETPPEVIAGSTRMGAGTAQKIALNMLSTLVGIHLGHVHDGHMVNLCADNAKLKERARRMVRDIARCDEETAATCVEQAGGSVKVAVLLAAGAGTVRRADAILSANNHRLRPSLADLSET